MAGAYRPFVLLTLIEALYPRQSRRAGLRRAVQRQGPNRILRGRLISKERLRRRRRWATVLCILALVALLVTSGVLLRRLGERYARQLEEDMAGLAWLRTPQEVGRAYDGYIAKRTLFGLDFGFLMPAYDVDTAFSRLPLYEAALSDKAAQAQAYEQASACEEEDPLRAARLFLLAGDYRDAPGRFAKAVRGMQEPFETTSTLTHPVLSFAGEEPDIEEIVEIVSGMEERLSYDVLGLDIKIAFPGQGSVSLWDIAQVMTVHGRGQPGGATQARLFLLWDGRVLVDEEGMRWRTEGWRNVQAVTELHYDGEHHLLARCRDGSYLSTDQGLEAFLGEGFAQVSAGVDHVVALRKDGTAAAYGNEADGRCEVGHWQGVLAVTAGNMSSAALLEDGTVVAVGRGLPLIGRETVALDVVRMTVYAPDEEGDDFLLLGADGVLRDTGDVIYKEVLLEGGGYDVLRDPRGISVEVTAPGGEPEPEKSFYIRER